MSESDRTDQFALWQLNSGFANTAVLHALVRTGVVENIARGHHVLSELASICKVDENVLYRILRYASLIDVIKHKNNQYTLTKKGRLLLKDEPKSLYRGILLLGSEPWQRSWQNLSYALTTGQSAFDQVFGMPFFDYLDEHSEYGIPFHQNMTSSTASAVQAIVEAYDFSPFQSICDIGGGQGVLLKQILQSYPQLKAILYDQEKALKETVFKDLDERVEIQSGDFFTSIPEADVLLLKNILHDGNNQDCQLILKQCKKVMNPSSRLLIIELMLSNPTDLYSAFNDLNMQVLFGGQERTEDEFTALLNSVGLRLTQVIPTQSPFKIIEVRL